MTVTPKVLATARLEDISEQNAEPLHFCNRIPFVCKSEEALEEALSAA
jgi:hypothetical protein